MECVGAATCCSSREHMYKCTYNADALGSLLLAAWAVSGGVVLYYL